MTKLEGIIRFEKIRDKHMCSKDSSLMQEFRKLIGEIFDDFNYPEHKHQAEKQAQQSQEFESDVYLKELCKSQAKQIASLKVKLQELTQ